MRGSIFVIPLLKTYAFMPTDLPFWSRKRKCGPSASPFLEFHFSCVILQHRGYVRIRHDTKVRMANSRVSPVLVVSKLPGRRFPLHPSPNGSRLSSPPPSFPPPSMVVRNRPISQPMHGLMQGSPISRTHRFIRTSPGPGSGVSNSTTFVEMEPGLS